MSCSSDNPDPVLCRQGRSDLLMTALKNNVLRDHLCWLWRVGDESSHPVLSQAALLSEQVLRILGVEHSSLDHLLCQVSARSAHLPEFHAFYCCISWVRRKGFTLEHMLCQLSMRMGLPECSPLRQDQMRFQPGFLSIGQLKLHSLHGYAELDSCALQH